MPLGGLLEGLPLAVLPQMPQMIDSFLYGHDVRATNSQDDNGEGK